jgi:hypothetical protein
MKQISLLFISLFTVAACFAQKDTSTAGKKKDWAKVNISNRPNDHFMVQLGYDGWAGAPDTLNIKGFSHSVNIYFMLDFPFKTDPRYSVGLGVGIGSSNIKFKNQEVSIASTGGTLPFPNTTNTDHFKKYKLTSAYFEAPVELRFVGDPENSDKSWKGALGIKFGALLNVHTRGKTLLTPTGSTENNYVLKETSTRFFNGTRFCGTARVGYGHVSLFGQYQINAFIRDGLGPAVHPYSIGLTFSGL